MATRVRQSNATPTSQSNAARRSTAGTNSTELPDYEAPEFSLTPAAQRALAQLTRTHDHDFSKLEGNLDNAHVEITTVVAEINDILYERNARTQRVREKRKEAGEVDGEDGSLDALEESVTQMRDKVKGMTGRMEQKVRKIIDGKHEVQHMRKAMAFTAEDARNNASTQASSLNTRSQRTRRQPDDEQEPDDEELPDFEPTDPAAGTALVNPPLDVFRKQLEDQKVQYQSFDYTTRYAEDNDYINFKRAVHDALYPDDEVPLPPNNEWFLDDGTVAPVGVTGHTQAGAEDDSDDDIAMTRATVSTKCSLSLQEFVDPITSSKCPHSFEKRHIYEFIGNSTRRMPASNGRPGEKAVQCPVPGCNEMLTKDDLRVDPVLVRKIKRLQKAKVTEAEGSDGEENGAPDGTQRNAHHIIDDDDDEEQDATNIDGMDVDEPPVKPKKEPRPTGASTDGASKAPRPSQAIDLLDDDEEEED